MCIRALERVIDGYIMSVCSCIMALERAIDGYIMSV